MGHPAHNTTGLASNSSSHGEWTPFAGTFVSPGVSYLFERRNKRGLRFEAAKQGTAIGLAQQSDSERTLLFNLRAAFGIAAQTGARSRHHDHTFLRAAL